MRVASIDGTGSLLLRWGDVAERWAVVEKLLEVPDPGRPVPTRSDDTLAFRTERPEKREWPVLLQSHLVREVDQFGARLCVPQLNVWVIRRENPQLVRTGGCVTAIETRFVDLDQLGSGPGIPNPRV